MAIRNTENCAELESSQCHERASPKNLRFTEEQAISYEDLEVERPMQRPSFQAHSTTATEAGYNYVGAYQKPQ